MVWIAVHCVGRAPLENLSAIYLVGSWIPIMVINGFEGMRMMAYLREHHKDKWIELTTIPGFGAGNVNGFRVLPWLFSSENLGDELLENIKRDHRRFIYFVLTVFFTFPLFWFVFSM